MIVALLVLALDVPSTADACAAAALQPAVAQAAAAVGRKDLAAAKTLIAAAAACPVRDGATYAGHVLRADIAVREGDWVGALSVLPADPPHAETSLGARAAFLRLRADQGLQDAGAFKRDRNDMLTADDAGLASAGRRVETFRTAVASVAAYAAPIDQGAFHRVLEFIVTPDDPAAYPVSIQLTDDVQADKIQAELSKGAVAPPRIWFLDLYTCSAHATLPPTPAPADGSQPSYAETKARVLAALADDSAVTVKAGPDRLSCPSAHWIMPGFGAHRPS